MRPRSAISVGAFLVWTIFVWGIVRVRNIMGDADLSTPERTWPLILAATLWVPAAVLLVTLLVTLLRKRPFAQAATIGVAVLGVWTTLVWIVRAFDIALVSNRELPFIAVHLVLAVISVALAVIAARSLRPELQSNVL
ncbi:unannotated protein [freshwater metagenome]|uniref:Unannotated protein n=1 Tax=freshwater metagenome TaxID=449393 RepID=A0A6J7H4G0_9ZZZZ|nr:hypothetical protein [Actinomycetota bacterium]MTA64482.1 hypothetical protein [Actinomycetota bacterium]